MKARTIAVAAGAALTAGALAGCSTPTEQMTFKSRQEQACYERVSATLPADRQLRRDSSGNFVEATIINAQLRDVQVSEEFNACMVSQANPGSLSDMGTVTFTPAEQRIWDTLTDDAKREALIFIRNGGTLREFVAS